MSMRREDPQGSRGGCLDIIVPFWGEPAYLYTAVDSVLAQTSDAWTMTIIDDCYPDPTVAEHFAALDNPRIAYVRNERNLGITDNYRKGLTYATHEHVMFLGCDDEMHPMFVENVLRALARRPGVDIVQPGVRVINEDGDVYDPLADRVKRQLRPDDQGDVVLSGEGLAASLLRGDWLYWPSLVFRTDSVREVEFLDDFPLIQDLGIVLEMVRRGAKLLVLPEPVFSYRRHANSASSAKLLDGGRFADERRFFRMQATKMRELGWVTAARAARLHVTSRLHAVSLLPKAIKQRRLSSVWVLLRHAANTGR